MPLLRRCSAQATRIKKQIRSKGTTMVKLSTDHGYSSAAVSKALRRPWPAVERIIADFLGTSPESLWPERYGPGRISTVRLSGRQYRAAPDKSHRQNAGGA